MHVPCLETGRETLLEDSSGGTVKRIYELLARIETYVAAFGFVIVCFIIFSSAIMRGIGQPLNWAWEMSLFFFAWSVFLAADSAMRHDRLINVDLVVNAFPERWRERLTLANHIIILCFLAAMVGFGTVLSYTTRARTFQGMPNFSYTWVTLSVPVGGALQIITVIGKLRSGIRRLRDGDRNATNLPVDGSTA